MKKDIWGKEKFAQKKIFKQIFDAWISGPLYILSQDISGDPLKLFKVFSARPMLTLEHATPAETVHRARSRKSTDIQVTNTKTSLSL